MSDRPYVVILGTGRSGTKYMHKVLRTSGLDVGHERFGRDGGSGWPMVGQLHTIKHDSPVILHQMRPAQPCISSMVLFLKCHWEAMKSKCNVSYPIEDGIALRALNWVDWNRRCAAAARWTYFVEDLARPSLRLKIEREIGPTPNPIEWGAVPTTTNHFDHGETTRADMRAADAEIAEQAEAYDREMWEGRVLS